ncbi:MAG: T9SS type A sorting domain-containing protein [Saprospiraceae bacterium]|nr:T9SS type A sorting domain-containing protein [Saprospiraceae bacterium]MBK7796847.1 T9SS type A sorting domain-containing protein [Saprospiraceae bacterium]
MKQFFTFILILISFHSYLNAQYFSKIYDHEPKGQCQHYFVIPQGDSIYVLGDYIDSARAAIRPFRAIFDYEGYRIAFDTLWDEKYKKHFNMSKGDFFAIKNDSVIYFMTRRVIDDQSELENYIIELNLRSAEIVNSCYFKNDDIGLLSDLRYDMRNERLIAASFSFDQTNKIEILELNSNLELIKRIKVIDSNYTHIWPDFVQKKAEDYIIVGSSGKAPDLVGTRRLMRLECDSVGKILRYKRLASSVPVSTWIYTNKYIHQRSDGDFVMTPTLLVKNIDTNILNSNNAFPHPVRASPDFDTVRWELKMYSEPYLRLPRNYFQAMIPVNHDSAYIALGHDIDTLSGNCVLYKFSAVGDSLWYKRIIPGDARRDSLSFVPSYHIAQSPGGGILVVGSIHDERIGKIRAYMMYLDEEGCLVPGCNETTSSEQVEKNRERFFRIHPNPVSDQLYLLSHYEGEEVIHLNFYTIDGVLVCSRSYHNRKYDQVFWSLDDLNTGSYVIQITDHKGRVLQTEKLIIAR